MPRHVLVLLVTFDLWVSFLVSVNPVFVFWIWLCSCFCWLAGPGPGQGCWAARAPAGLGEPPISPAPSASVPDPEPPATRHGALLSPHTAWASHVCVRLGLTQWQGSHKGPSQSAHPPTASTPTAADHGWRVCGGPQRHEVPPCVFLLASSQHAWALAADPSFVPVGFPWASSGTPGPTWEFPVLLPT